MLRNPLRIYGTYLVTPAPLWLMPFLGGSIGSAAAYFQQQPSVLWVGVICALIAGAVTILAKVIDVVNERWKAKQAKKEKAQGEQELDEAAAIAEKSQLRLEERTYYQSIIERAIEERRIAGARGHAYSNEVDRLRNQTLKLLRAWPRTADEPPEVIIFNEDLNRTLAELEGLPLPPLAVRPGSLGDPHKTSSPDLPASAFRPPQT